MFFNSFPEVAFKPTFKQFKPEFLCESIPGYIGTSGLAQWDTTDQYMTGIFPSFWGIIDYRMVPGHRYWRHLLDPTPLLFWNYLAYPLPLALIYSWLMTHDCCIHPLSVLFMIPLTHHCLNQHFYQHLEVKGRIGKMAWQVLQNWY